MVRDPSIVSPSLTGIWVLVGGRGGGHFVCLLCNKGPLCCAPRVVIETLLSHRQTNNRRESILPLLTEASSGQPRKYVPRPTWWSRADARWSLGDGHASAPPRKDACLTSFSAGPSRGCGVPLKGLTRRPSLRVTRRARPCGARQVAARSRVGVPETLRSGRRRGDSGGLVAIRRSRGLSEVRAGRCGLGGRGCFARAEAGAGAGEPAGLDSAFFVWRGVARLAVAGLLPRSRGLLKLACSSLDSSPLHARTRRWRRIEADAT